MGSVRVWGWVWGCGWRFRDYMGTLQGEGLRILVIVLVFGVRVTSKVECMGSSVRVHGSSWGSRSQIS